MSLRPNTIITITQQSNLVYPTGRDKVFTIDFCNSCVIDSSWQNLTDTAKIKIPRNILVLDKDGNKVNFGGQAGQPGTSNIYGGGNGELPAPLFMRGDKISIALGYFYDSMDGKKESLEMHEIFTGYITKIKARVPIEIDCEDEMWKLKQILCPNKMFSGKDYTVQKMLTELLDGTGIKVIDGVEGTIKTSVGDFRTQNETVAQVLERLRKDGGLYSYFRDGKLRCSGIVYYPQDRNEEIFRFQENIISDTLEYTRKEDLNIAVKAYATFLTSKTGNNLDGSPKNKRQRVEVMVTVIDHKTGKIGALRKEDEKTFHGDLITLPVLIPNNIENLELSTKGVKVTELDYITQKAIEYLPKFYYTGFRGDFLTFGQPFVRHGDAAIIQDRIIPERDGTYLIKHVTTSTGMQGFRQKILLYLRIDEGFTIDQINAGL